MKTADKTIGLRYWMLQVLAECDNVSANFSADPVHDLRVSLRRCRSMADGMMAMDPDPAWKDMKKAGKALFQRLGALRDIQVMMDWIDKLEPKVNKINNKNHVERALLPASTHEQIAQSRAETNEADPDEAGPNEAEPNEIEVNHDHRESSEPRPRDSAANALLSLLRHRETEQKREARAALEEFDRRQWRQWSKTLPQRAHIRPGSIVFKHLALERWTAARELHARAMRNRSQVALHATRIGLKRFRYIVENFLPVEHKLWSASLKEMQDLLGEVHDLDVLWATALSSRVFPDAASRRRWHECIVRERTRRVAEYRSKMIGPDSLWNVWRAALPQGNQVQQIATRRMKLWAQMLDPDFAHSERVARLALALYDGLSRAGLLGSQIANNGVADNDGSTANSNMRSSLYAAALLHDVGKSRGKKGHHKVSLELIKKHGVPLGWNDNDMRRAAVVARFHIGALPRRSHKALRDLLPNEQKSVIGLSAILRLANALDVAHDGHIRRVKIENSTPAARRNGFRSKPPALGKNQAVVIAAEGYVPSTPTAQTIAAERYLLETVLRRPVIVKAMKTTAATAIRS